MIILTSLIKMNPILSNMRAVFLNGFRGKIRISNNRETRCISHFYYNTFLHFILIRELFRLAIYKSHLCYLLLERRRFFFLSSNRY